MKPTKVVLLLFSFLFLFSCGKSFSTGLDQGSATVNVAGSPDPVVKPPVVKPPIKPPVEPPVVLHCPATTRTITSSPNASGQTQQCVATLPLSLPAVKPINATSVTNGGTYSLICQNIADPNDDSKDKDAAKWAVNPSTSSCPPPAVVPPATVTFVWTTNPPINPAIVYNANKTLSFSITPAGSWTYRCLSRITNQSTLTQISCASATSLVASIEGDREYLVQVTLSNGQTQLSPPTRVRLDKTNPVLTVNPVVRSADGLTYTYTLVPSEAIAYVIYKLDGALVSNTGTSLVYPVTVNANDYNLHTVSFQVADFAGNMSTIETRTFQRMQPEPAQNPFLAGLLLQRTNDDRSGQPGNGSVISWDGKLMVRSAGYWLASVFRPQNVVVGTNLTHHVDLSGAAFSTPMTIMHERLIRGSAGNGYGAYDSANYIKMLYRILLNREPDTASFNTYFAALENATLTPQELYNAFINSAEYLAIVAAHPEHANHPRIIPASTYTEYNALTLAPYYTDRAFLLDAYQNILGQQPDAAGFAYWLNALKTISRDALTQSFVANFGGDPTMLPHKFKNYSRLASTENPYRSDITGEYSETGAYRTYDVLLYTQVYKIFQFVPTPPPYGRSPDLESLPNDTLGVMRARFIVENPDTPAAALSGYYIMDDFKPIKTSGNYIIGIEPTVTADGLFMVFNENRTQGVLKYLYTQDPLNAEAWSAPKQLTSLYLDKDQLIHGIKLGERYPLAKSPILSPTGEAYTPTEGIKGAYPWVTWEGTEVYFTSLVSKNINPALDARRAGVSVVGQWTGHAVRMLDGFVNKGLLAYEKLVLFTGGIGSTSSFWNPFKNISDPKLPFLYERPSVMLMGFNDNTYSDVSFKEFVDGRYVLAWPMGEALKKINATSASYGLVDFTKTPDLSGNFNTGLLNAGAIFQSQSGFGNINDTYIGYKGQAIKFTGAGTVSVAANPTFQKMDSFTVEAFVLPMQNVNMKIAQFGDGTNNSILINYMQGRITASIVAGTAFNIDSGSLVLPFMIWSHVALTYNHMGGTLKLYINGKMVSQVLTNPVPLTKPTTYGFKVGPSGTDTGIGEVVRLDEVRLSYVARSPVEIADAAHLPYSQRFNFNLTLPPRITKENLKIPDEQMISLRKAQVGSILFHDNRLSGNNTISCASCHGDANLSDPRQFSLGSGGNSLTRHSPVIFNRGLSSTQMWDGKFSSLHAQTLGPLTNPNEMNLTSATLLARLNSIPAYREAFNLAYSQDVNLNNLQQALSSFLTVMMTSNTSPADQFELTGTGLNESQLRGRKLFFGQARCSACHSGPNYTDEQLHNVGIFATSPDLGKKGITGRDTDLHYFKTPSLRNVAQTSPYTHDGGLTTLEQVITKYNQGGLTDDHRSNEIKPLNLSPTDITDLAEYLRALSSPVMPIVPINTNPNYTIEQFVQGL